MRIQAKKERQAAKRDIREEIAKEMKTEAQIKAEQEFEAAYYEMRAAGFSHEEVVDLLRIHDEGRVLMIDERTGNDIHE